MKKYSPPKLIEICGDSKGIEAIFPSTGALTGAASMVARSAAKASVQEKYCQPLQEKFTKE